MRTGICVMILSIQNRISIMLAWLCFGIATWLCFGCSTTSQDRQHLVWPAKQGSAESFITCRESFSSVRLAYTDSLDDHGLPIEIALNPKEQTEIVSIIDKAEAAEGHAMTPPPWPVAFVFADSVCGTWVATLIGTDRLRFNAENPRSARIMGDDHITPVATEVIVPDSSQILWRLLESKLGETRVKQYRMDF
jgi:hypothetical protein